MALYTIADLHLACSVNKPMDVFGGKWQNYPWFDYENDSPLIEG